MIAGDQVVGRLLQWAREEQEYTMRWVYEHGGPSPGYQSEVERGLKQEVSSEVLGSWVHILGITPAFARGQVPSVHENPVACAGLARSIALAIAEGRPDHPDWAALDPVERVREVLCQISRHCPHLPRVVLAHVLGLSLSALDAMMLGHHPILKEPAQAIALLTTLGDPFWLFGEREQPDESGLIHRYLVPIRLATQMGITPEQMTAWIRRRQRRASS